MNSLTPSASQPVSQPARRKWKTDSNIKAWDCVLLHYFRHIFMQHRHDRGSCYTHVCVLHLLLFFMCVCVCVCVYISVPCVFARAVFCMQASECLPQNTPPKSVLWARHNSRGGRTFFSSSSFCFATSTKQKHPPPHVSAVSRAEKTTGKPLV